MKKLCVVGLLSAFAFGLFGSTAYADSDNSADVVSDQLCVCGTCGAILGTPALVTFDARAVGTSAGTVTLQCHFDIPEGFEPARAIVTESPACGTPFGPANKSHIVLSPGGKAKLTCQVNPAGD